MFHRVHNNIELNATQFLLLLSFVFSIFCLLFTQFRCVLCVWTKRHPIMVAFMTGTATLRYRMHYKERNEEKEKQRETSSWASSVWHILHTHTAPIYGIGVYTEFELPVVVVVVVVEKWKGNFSRDPIFSHKCWFYSHLIHVPVIRSQNRDRLRMEYMVFVMFNAVCTVHNATHWPSSSQLI